MLEKTKQKLARKERKTWVGLYVRKTSTKRELEIRIARKHKNKMIGE